MTDVVVHQGKPIPKGRPVFSKRGGRPRTPEKTRRHEESLAWAFTVAGWKYRHPAGQKLVVEIGFYGAHHAADVDNLVKAVLDAMQAARVIHNDRDVVSIHAHRYAVDARGARTEIRSTTLTPKEHDA